MASSKMTMGASFMMARAMGWRSRPKAGRRPPRNAVCHNTAAAAVELVAAGALNGGSTSAYVSFVPAYAEQSLFSTVSLNRYTFWNTIDTCASSGSRPCPCASQLKQLLLASVNPESGPPGSPGNRSYPSRWAHDG